MRSADRLYRVQLGVGLVGALATALALVTASTRVSFEAPSLGALVAACRQLGLTDFSLASLLVLSLSSLSLAVIALAARSAVRQLRTGRAFLRQTTVVAQTCVAGEQVRVVDDQRPQAFCTGLLSARIFISTGALELLDQRQLAAVIAHEGHHARRRDPLRLFVARTLADGLFFLPLLSTLAERHAALAELAADEAAVARSGSRKPLAGALLAFEASPNAAAVGIAPERVDHLLGERPRWELPLALLAGAALTLGGLLGLVARSAAGTGDASLELPAVVAQACMLAMTAFPVLAGAALVLAARRALLARRRY